MNAQQRQALQYPCLLGFDVTHPRFARRLRWHSEVLSINKGYE